MPKPADISDDEAQNRATLHKWKHEMKVHYEKEKSSKEGNPSMWSLILSSSWDLVRKILKSMAEYEAKEIDKDVA